MNYYQLIELCQRSGFISGVRGASCCYHVWKLGDDVPNAIELFRRNAPELFHPHRRGHK